ncbi:Zn-dependent hydrolase [Ensifer adhaerens]|uniref:Zn-dependent hydrolase n=1 Tax=Ensifer adhaerens TaxID=106592 RepID=UPI00098F30BD|nr:Zn-dependent hydrolase [Ensifer adhaerens]
MQHAINGERLWKRLMAMAEVGATPEGGSCRQTLSDADEAGRALLLGWCAQRGYRIRRDRIGNLFIRREGRDPAAPAVLIGSHLDTQPTGGRFDGVLGVLAGLEVLETLDDRSVETIRPIELCVWTNEEGCRFQPAMMGSGVACGVLELETVLSVRDSAGVTVDDDLIRLGYGREALPQLADADCYLELHIEQGPILEAEGKTIGVVTGGQGIRWYEISLVGEETHAGPVPMAMRKDPVPVLMRVIGLVQEIGRTDDLARCTIGCIELSPNSINVVPGRVELTVDLRHPDETVLEGMHRRLLSGLNTLLKSHEGIDIECRLSWHSPVVAFDDALIEAVRASAGDRDLTSRDIVSGAGHDAFNLARRVPTTMIFVPCRGGISHNPNEYATPADVTAGTNVLLDVTLTRARS